MHGDDESDKFTVKLQNNTPLPESTGPCYQD